MLWKISSFGLSKETACPEGCLSSTGQVSQLGHTRQGGASNIAPSVTLLFIIWLKETRKLRKPPPIQESHLHSLQQERRERVPETVKAGAGQEESPLLRRAMWGLAGRVKHQQGRNNCWEPARRNKADTKLGKEEVGTWAEPLPPERWEEPCDLDQSQELWRAQSRVEGHTPTDQKMKGNGHIVSIW